jgi:hypothetical protein
MKTGNEPLLINRFMSIYETLDNKVNNQNKQKCFNEIINTWPVTYRLIDNTSDFSIAFYTKSFKILSM